MRGQPAGQQRGTLSVGRRGGGKAPGFSEVEGLLAAVIWFSCLRHTRRQSDQLVSELEGS